jgi:cation:H+ antiporter
VSHPGIAFTCNTKHGVQVKMYFYVLVVVGIGVLIWGGELLVRGATLLAEQMRITPLLIGLTVVAFGTSAPELAISLRGVISGHADLSVGNILGSNIYNILLVLGIASLLTPLTTSSQLVRFDVPVMILASLAVPFMTRDGQIDRIESASLCGGLLIYSFWSFLRGRRARASCKFKPASEGQQRKHLRAVVYGNIARILFGLLLLTIGSKWLVEGAVGIARQLGAGELIIGLTVIALGTSLPEMVTAVVAIARGQRDMAVGNVVGSNIFNILGVLGISGLFSSHGFHVPLEAIRFDIPVMVTVAIACLPIFFTGRGIARWEGGLFLGYFMAYTAFLILEAADSHHLRHFSVVMVFFVIPLTTITLLVSGLRGILNPHDGE